jgi:hypothetical protein
MHSKMSRIATAAVAIVAIAAAAAAQASQAAAQASQAAASPLPQDKLDIQAFAVNMNATAPGAAAMVRIRIERWSSADERNSLINTLLTKTSNDLLKELSKTKSTGRFSIPGLQGPDPHELRLGHDLHYAWQTPLPDGGRRIVIATDRYIGYWEARDQPRSIDYPFTFFEIHVNKAGEGEGKMAVATKLTVNKETKSIELENYGIAPVRLNQVKVTTRK